MGEITQLHKPIRLELDSSEELRSQFNAQFLKNVRPNVNINSQFASQGNTIIQGSNEGDLTPTQSNEILCDIDLPEGNNICTGAFKSVVTKEIYFEVWNDLSNHSLWVSSSETNTCRKIYEGACLGYRFESQYHLPEHRCSLFVIYDQGDNGEKTIKSKFYVWTDGITWQGFIDVETSIATDSFNANTFPYWKTFYPQCDQCEFIQLGFRPPDCPKVLPLDDTTQLQFYETPPAGNNLKQKVWYFRTRGIGRDGRHSVMSPFSTPMFLDGGDCNVDAEDVKCFNVVLDAGSALWEKIEVYFSNDGVNWFLYDTIDKWDNCMSPQPDDFWERDLALKNYYAPNSDSPPCTPTGCFSTFVYTWNFHQSPAIDFNSVTITIDGVEYTNPTVLGFHGLLLWLNGLGKGSFTLDTDIVSVSSASIIYENIELNDSPSQLFEPVITEVDQCGTVNTFIYQFCGNKGCAPISTTESDRIFDELPIASVAQTAIDNQIAFGDNLTGYDNFICPLDKIHIEAVQDDVPCETENVTITIDAVIHNPYRNVNNFIYTPAGTTEAAFGGLGLPLPIPDIVQWEDEVISAYNQKIANQYKGSVKDGNQGSYGFIGGMRGTNFKAVSQQYYINDLSKTFFFDNVDHNHSTKSIMQGIIDGNYVIQRWVFSIPKGNYIFEVYSHLATSFDDCVGTSTYFLGVIPKNLYNPSANIELVTDKNVREVLIQACDGNVEYSNFIVISDLTKPKSGISVAADSRSVAGYLSEKETAIPIELAELHKQDAGAFVIQSFGTDANGFYFATDDADFDYNLFVLKPDTCLPTQVKTTNLEGHSKSLLQIDVIIDNPTLGAFNDCGHELVSGTITDCDGNPIKGVTVLLTRTATAGVTDEDGIYTILAHDNADLHSQTGQTRKQENADSLVISQQGICLYATCSGSPDCDTCINIQHVTFTNSCFHCSSQSPPETPTDIYNFELQIISGALTGVKTGSTRAISIIGYDELDRNNEAQRIGFFTVPTLQSNGVFAPYHFNWSITGATFPLWVKKLRFAVQEATSVFLLSWDTNKVEFLDSQGNITAPAIAANIKIYIDGLNTFIQNNLLNTNVSYQWVFGDRIRFITNGDGTTYLENDNNGLIDLPVSSLVNGNALLIPFDPRLINLVANATFELYRVPICTTEPIYLEQCPTIAVIDGIPQITSGTLDYFDTYMFYRAIPQTDQNNNPSIFISNHRYEHHSPSDFWGSHLSTFGRPFVRNENARQTWKQSEIRYSDELLEDGVINGLSTFRSANFKNYFVPDSGGIIAMKAQTGLLFALCESNWFVVNIAQNLLMITAQGNIQANPDYLGNKQQKIGNIYGVDARDTSTVIFRQEWITWGDAQRSAWCKSNYQTVYDITQNNEGVSEGNFKGYWLQKFQRIAELRNQNQFTDTFLFLHSAYDPKTDEVIITSFGRVGSPSEIEYVNQERDYAINLNETISFNIGGGYFSGGYSFTPDRMIDFGSGEKGQQLIAFKGGIPYIHHKQITTGITYCNFFGEQCEPVIKFVFNGGQGKNEIQKRFLAIRILCKQSLFYSDEIWTESQQNSNIPLEDGVMIEDYSEIAFLCDSLSVQPNGISAIQDGDSLAGSWIKIRVLIDPANKDKYFNLEGIIISATQSF